MPELYFAYGSNLDPERMRALCPSARLRGVVRLDGFRLACTVHSDDWSGGVADLVPASGERVFGALYELSDFAALDEYEGEKYVRTRIDVCDAGGAIHSAWVYVVVAREGDLLPSQAYLDCVVAGARAVGLPQDYVAALSCRPRRRQSTE